MKLIVVALIVVAVALSLAVYSRLPARVPVHWNGAGEIDNYAPKIFGAFLIPVVMVIAGGVFAALPAISPSGFDIERTSRAYAAIMVAVLLFMLGIHVYLLLAALNMARSITIVIPLLVGALLIILGNFLPKMRRNFFIGIRTPWTLADEDVWFRTHRVGGILFVICGALLMAIGPFLHGGAAAAFVITLLAFTALITVVYSFVIYRRPDSGSDKGEASS